MQIGKANITEQREQLNGVEIYEEDSIPQPSLQFNIKELLLESIIPTSNRTDKDNLSKQKSKQTNKTNVHIIFPIKTIYSVKQKANISRFSQGFPYMS